MALGYTEDNLAAMPYDWRLPPGEVQSRDSFFTNMKATVEMLYKKNGNTPIMFICHSMGNLMVKYFLHLMQDTEGQEWLDKHIYMLFSVAAPWLGAPKGHRSILTGSEIGLEYLLSLQVTKNINRSFGSFPMLFPRGLKFHNTFPSTAMTYMLKFSEENNIEPIPFPMALSMANLNHIDMIHRTHYKKNPIWGGLLGEERILSPPPVSRFVHCYGIDVPTQKFFFLKFISETQDWELDKEVPADLLKGYWIHGGIAYETPSTPQKIYQDLYGTEVTHSGDGTIPYDSLVYCTQWKDNFELFKIHEIKGGEHRAITGSIELLGHIVKYCCRERKTKTS
eukprot:TRINITY_DN5051_c0_g1_i6.p1 TRINITY_DN5051_c0_g1~~TRINITY_DN5051_c0_g1_i6.p1  ORF type:complete len:337 (+),score=69.92 TRINITY_DN5051_c0_g1_i6:80-1090(+)